MDTHMGYIVKKMDREKNELSAWRFISTFHLYIPKRSNLWRGYFFWYGINM